ncbi:NAD(P)/FAD-dependent oxidoreductase [Hymenobacter lucidus]|uniref:NAD(P)/FAD-dependent oxidoreductase n=1 Tax=Hymenobacter lucidus TaxID=2880930 RepID=A0ABS8ATD5_9BACT|nr:NAD(P)/FAD-dependent oxidoreductase [Hymenobacter lucidus]MCB2407976.1 NAD(P)/FAD-dependent oxidoreductase [Hymenobacter lucidus]
MENITQTEVLIIGGSYAGLAAAMSLGRALRRVVVLDSGQPCNRQTPHAHNFLTQDGETPAAIRERGRAQVLAYPTVTFVAEQAVAATRQPTGFAVTTAAGHTITARKLIFATGVRDLLPALPGFAECWGISVLHCPYCHGYEVHGQPLGVLGNGEIGFEFARLIRHWTPQLTLFTNGPATLTAEHTRQLRAAGIRVEEGEITQLVHESGQLQHLRLREGRSIERTALFARVPFEQSSPLPAALGCALTELGHLQVDEMQKTSVAGIYAAGDATTPMRAVAAAVAAGSKAGAMLNHELIAERVW